MINIQGSGTVSLGGAESASLGKRQAVEGAFEEALKKAAEDKNSEELKKACSQFESYFFQMVLREMRKTTFASEKSRAQEIFTDMLDEEYSKLAASAGGVGLADEMYRQMSVNLNI
jgi:flagellar protein FlgJ